MYRISMRDDYVFERKLQYLAQSGQHVLLVPRCSPDPKLSSWRGQAVSKNEGSLLRQPKRRFVLTPSIVQGDDTSRKTAARLKGVQIGLGNIVAKEESRTKCSGTVAAHEQIGIPDVIRF